MLTIKVVLVNGKLVGQDFSSRWNLAQLGYTHFNMANIRQEMKVFRRMFGKDFIIDTVKAEMVGISEEERNMFGRHVARIAA